MTLLITAVMLCPWKTIFDNRFRETAWLALMGCLLLTGSCSSITISPDSLWSAMMKVTSDLWPKRDVAVQPNEMWRVDPRIYGPKENSLFCSIFYIVINGWNRHLCIFTSFQFKAVLLRVFTGCPSRVNMVVVNPDGSAMILNAFMIVSSWASPWDWLSSSSLRSALLGVRGAECPVVWDEFAGRSIFLWLLRSLRCILKVSVNRFLKDLHLKGLTDHNNLHSSFMYLWLISNEEKMNISHSFRKCLCGQLQISV